MRGPRPFCSIVAVAFAVACQPGTTITATDIGNPDDGPYSGPSPTLIDIHIDVHDAMTDEPLDLPAARIGCIRSSGSEPALVDGGLARWHCFVASDDALAIRVDGTPVHVDSTFTVSWPDSVTAGFHRATLRLPAR